MNLLGAALNTVGGKKGDWNGEGLRPFTTRNGVWHVRNTDSLDATR